MLKGKAPVAEINDDIVLKNFGETSLTPMGTISDDENKSAFEKHRGKRRASFDSIEKGLAAEVRQSMTGTSHLVDFGVKKNNSVKNLPERRRDL